MIFFLILFSCFARKKEHQMCMLLMRKTGGYSLHSVFAGLKFPTTVI